MDARTADSDEEDSDYVPEPDNDDNEGNGQEQRKLTGMTSSRKRKVDSIFEEMQSEDKKELDSRMMRSFSSSKSKGEGGSRVGKSSKKRRDEAILASIFGREVGKKISSASSFAVGSCSTTKANGEELKRRALASAKAVLKKTKVTETRKFAGKEIRLVIVCTCASHNCAINFNMLFTGSVAPLNKDLAPYFSQPQHNIFSTCMHEYNNA